MIRTEHLYSRDSKKKIRLLKIEISPKGLGYVIKQSSGILGGKMKDAPEKLIEKGKVKRTTEEQVELEVNSIMNKKKDKGYLNFNQLVDAEVLDLVDPLDYDVIDSLLSKNKKDASGSNIPMFAQNAHKTNKKTGLPEKDVKYFERAWWVSAKIDGIRALGRVKVNEDGEKYIEFTSRTGKVIGPATGNFYKDPELIAFMEEHNCEIDGEIYKHGWHLNTINGAVSKKTYVPERHDPLCFYVFDMAKDEMDASERVKILNKLEISNKFITVLKHTYCISYKEIMIMHDRYVEQEYEGAMARTAIGMYEFGKRSSEIWKFKKFEDAEFRIVGIKEGVGPADMCFMMLTDDDKEFDCKPMGGAEIVQEYRDNLDSIINKKLGTVKFFGWTSKGIPNIAKLKCIKDDN